MTYVDFGGNSVCREHRVRYVCRTESHECIRVRIPNLPGFCRGYYEGQFSKREKAAMTAFMVWNVGKKNLDSLVQSLVREHKIDVLLLVEFYPAGSGSTLSTLLLGDGLTRRNISERFGVFTRHGFGARMQPVRNCPKLTRIFHLRFPSRDFFASSAKFVILSGCGRL